MATPFVFDPLEPRMLLSAAAAKFTAPSQPRIAVNLDPGWKFKKSNPSGASGKTYNDSSWSTVSLPHTWNNQDGQDGGNNYYRGVGWYRKHVTPASSMSGKRIFVRFDGANTSTDLYVNGTLAGSHKGGYAAFVFDVTSLIKVGADNVLAVKVNNASDSAVAPSSGDFTLGGGIYRDVTLIASNSAHVDLLDYGSPGVYLTPSNVSTDSATVSVKTKLKNDGSSSSSLSIEADIVDADGNVVASKTSSKTVSSNSSSTLTQTLTLDDPHLWSGTYDPYLYTTYIIVRSGSSVKDVISQPLGLRTFTVDAKKGFTLNGTAYDLHGMNLHQDRIDKGFAASDTDRAQDISLVQEMGATFVRLAHYQHEQTTYDLLDRAGIISSTEIPLVNSISSSTGSFATNIKQQLTELIRQNYNHPSIMFWGLFNEISDNSKAATLIPQLNTLAHSEDPTRKTTGSIALGVADNAGLNTYTDLLAENAYYGWYKGATKDFGPWIDALHKKYPTRLIGISEYGAGASVKQHELNPKSIVTDGEYHPEEYQSIVHEGTQTQIAARPWLWQKTVWNMFDFAADGRAEGDTAGRNDKGLVTYDRKTKKDAFYFYKASWSDEKFAYITSRRWTDRTSPSTDVKVYSNYPCVELIVNGDSQGIVQADRVFVWRGVTLAEGDNTIQVIGLPLVPVEGESDESSDYPTSDEVTWNLVTPPSDELESAETAPLGTLDFRAASVWKDLIDGQSKEE